MIAYILMNIAPGPKIDHPDTRQSSVAEMVVTGNTNHSLSL